MNLPFPEHAVIAPPYGADVLQWVESLIAEEEARFTYGPLSDSDTPDTNAK